MWKDFFYFSKIERQGILFLIALIVIIGVIGNMPHLFRPNDTVDINTDEVKTAYEAFLNSIEEVEVDKETSYYTKNKPEPVLAAFDPNTADSATFLKLGLPTWMAGNILKYRAKGGKFREADDFKKIYGLSKEQYNKLKPYIRIVSLPKESSHKDTVRLLAEHIQKDTIHRVIKYPAGTVIDINKADTTELKKIPGIGSGMAHRITNYRKELGGFHAVAQLADIHIDVEKFKDWFIVGNEPPITKVNLNRAGIEQLRKHPYINFYQAKAIVECRKKRGNLSGMQQLTLLDEFTETDFEKLKHYICF
ncbi:ComEA family DNA-binding protein [Bacteroides sp. 519]|uniref:ComEA family DNA-binding protein n=1 Tax=Bacteroides sp. 519 TaxID=2302937 RepID=UPI0013D52932|nr:helix-hairpin-helix domain-containing protein [Bacteroides sp. 519]NDV57287.1 helix-hairpin-helix domain-containing protein [Bacteroides sp. 519]